MLQQLGLALGGTQAIPAVQRSQYLADALKAMQSNGGPNIRTGGALASNLLAEGLLQLNRRRTDQALLQQIGASQTNMAADAQRDIYAPPPSPEAGASGGGPAPQPAPAPSFLAPQSANAAPPSPPQAAPLDPKADMLARLLIGEGGDMHNDADVVANRARLGGTDIAGAIAAPHQFEPYDNQATWAKLQGIPTTSPAYQKALAVALDELTNGPKTTFDHFYGPASQAALAKRDGRPVTPSWDNGTGQDVAGQRYFSLGYGGHPALAQPSQQIQTGPSPSLPMQGGAGGPNGGAQPYPASSPQGSPAGMPPQGLQPTPPPAQFPPQGGAGGGQGGPPTGPYATPQEAAFIQNGLRHPVGSMQFQAAVAKAQEIQQRRMTPLGLKPDEAYGPDGQARFIGPQAQQISRGPGGGQQRAPDGSISTYTNPNSGPLGPNQTFGPDGSVVNRQVQQQNTFRIPGANGIFTNGPDGRPVKVADDQFPQKDLGDRLTKLQSSPQYAAADNATNMFNAAVQASHRSGGISDVELRDFAARQFSGGVARQFNVGALDNGQGVWANLKQFLPEINSGQHLSPPARQAILQAMHDDAIQAKAAFGGLAKSDETYVQSASGGTQSLVPFLAPLSRDIPDVPGVATIPGGMEPQGQGVNPGGAAGGMFGVPPAVNDIAAELRRRGYHQGPNGWTK